MSALEEETKSDTAESLRFAVLEKLAVPEWRFTLLGFETGDDGVTFVDQGWVRFIEVAKTSENTGCLGYEAVLDQPTRRFGQEVDGDNDDQGGNELKTDRYTPLDLAGDVVESIADPLPYWLKDGVSTKSVGQTSDAAGAKEENLEGIAHRWRHRWFLVDKAAQLMVRMASGGQCICETLTKTTLDHHPTTAAFALGTFRLPARYGSDLQAESGPTDDTSNGQLSRAPSARLQNTSDQHEDHAQLDSQSTAETISEVQAGKSTKQCAEFEGCDDDAEGTGVVELWEDGLERVFGHQAT